MIALHGIWCFDAFHVFGERLTGHSGPGATSTGADLGATTPSTGADRGATTPSTGADPGATTASTGAGLGATTAATGADPEATTASTGAGPNPGDHPFALSVDELRDALGDVGDSLLVNDAAPGRLVLKLPTRRDRPVPSRPDDAAAHGVADVALRPWNLDALVFQPADGVELLVALPGSPQDDVHIGASLRYWSRAAELILRLLADQRLVPDVYRQSPDAYCGAWRVVIGDGPTRSVVDQLVTAMPPVCRSFMDTASANVDAVEPDPGRLLEAFLWRAADGLVRRCLDEMDLARAVQDRERDAPSPEVHWLASLVRPDDRILGPPEDAEAVRRKVVQWTAGLDAAPAPTFRTCLCLHAPEEPVELADATDGAGDAWRLTFKLESTSQPGMVLTARQVYGWPSHGLAILRRPTDNVAEQLREDLARAAGVFTPLQRRAPRDAPVECRVSDAEAYQFLREAAPVLQLEGFGIETPEWWDARSSEIGLRLNLKPTSDASRDTDEGLGLDTLVNFDWTLACGDAELTPEELSALIDARRPFVRLGGRWTEVNADAARETLRFLRDHAGGQTTVFDAMRLAHMPDAAQKGLPVIGVQASGWIERLLHPDGPNLTVEDVPPPDTLVGTLRPYQRVGLAWLDFLSRHALGACLADDMGLGKTIELLTLLLHERTGGARPGPTLVIVPMSVVGNWQRETQRFAPSLTLLVHHGLDRLSGDAFVAEVARHDLVVSTYGLAHRDFAHLSAVRWHRIVLDEAQNIKNPAAKQARAIRALTARRRVALTGTPIENRLSELWSIMDFLNPGYLGAASEFRRRFAVPIERHRDAAQSQRLRELIRPFVLRRVKTDPDILNDLPEKMEMNVYCNLTREQATLYESVTRDMLAQIDGAGGIQRRGLVLSAIVKLKQICNHPAHFLREDGPLPHRSGKCDRLRDMLEEVLAEGDHALVFTQFRQMGTRLQRFLAESLDREILFLHGGTPHKLRTSMVDHFQQRSSKTPVFILSLRAGGVGLNLTAANHVFHYDRWWNPAVEQQATDRAHRIGQLRRLQVHKFICIGTMEERVDAMLEAKRGLAEKIIGRGEAWLTDLSTDRLRSLFALSRDAVTD